jgi:hypothetical protein
MATVLSMGALAGAITAIISLRPTPDPEDSAAFTSEILVSAPLTLGEYTRSVTPAPRGFRPLPTSTPTSATAPTSTTPSFTDTRGPISSTTLSTSTSVTPLSPTTDQEPAVTMDRIQVPPSVDPVKLCTATSDALSRAGDEISVPKECVPAIKWIAAGSSVTPQGKPVSPAEAAAKVVQVLKNARLKKKEPVGVLVTANIELAGLRGKEVMVSWSMRQATGGKPVHADWMNENLVYRIVPGTARDTTSVDLWVPLPKATSSYVIAAGLTTGGSKLASAQSSPFTG